MSRQKAKIDIERTEYQEKLWIPKLVIAVELSWVGYVFIQWHGGVFGAISHIFALIKNSLL